MTTIDDNIASALKKSSGNARKKIIELSVRHKAAHLGSALSVVDILISLYFKVLKINPDNPSWEDRDRLIFSKGHAALALYTVLVERGFSSEDILDDYYANGTKLACHPVIGCMPGVETSTGSLGHGLSMGVGLAYGMKLDQKPSRVFIIMGDGECDEGSVWEAAMAASHLKLDNLIAIIDYNKFQGFGEVAKVMGLEPLGDKWRSFGWQVKEIDGHDFGQILSVFEEGMVESKKPLMIIAHTIKGKGVPSLEGRLESHYETPAPDQLDNIFKELM